VGLVGAQGGKRLHRAQACPGDFPPPALEPSFLARRRLRRARILKFKFPFALFLSFFFNAIQVTFSRRHLHPQKWGAGDLNGLYLCRRAAQRAEARAISD
jgi:hypothetical protein